MKSRLAHTSVQKSLAVLFLFVIPLVFFGCATGKQALKNGRFTKATHTSVKHLNRHPKSKTAAAVLSEAYPQAIDKWLLQIDHVHAAQDRFRWERAVDAYTELNRMAHAVLNSPPAQSLGIEPQPYLAEVNHAKEQAADAREQAGDELFSIDTQHHARQAYHHYAKALAFRPNDGNLGHKKSKALDKGTIYIALNIADGRSHSLNLTRLQQELENRLRGRSLHLFTQFVPYSNNPDHIAVVRVLSSDIGRESHSSSCHNYSKKIEVGKTKDDPPKPIYKTVTASAYSNSISKNSSATVAVTLIDARSNRSVFSSTVRESVYWSDTWFSNVSGDDRALPRGVSNQYCPSAPSDWSQESDLIYDVSRRAQRQLTSFYSDFDAILTARAVEPYRPEIAANE